MAFYHWGHWPPGSTWWPAQSPCWPQPHGQSAWAAHWWWGVEGSGAGPLSAKPCSVTGASGPPGTRTAHWGTSATISQEINLGSGRSSAIRQWAMSENNQSVNQSRFRKVCSNQTVISLGTHHSGTSANNPSRHTWLRNICNNLGTHQWGRSAAVSQ